MRLLVRRVMQYTMAAMIVSSVWARADDGTARKADNLTALDRYVHAPDDTYRWQVAQRTKNSAGEVVYVELTSQTWRGIVWKHQMFVCIPEERASKDTALLFITGGSNRSRVSMQDAMIGLVLARYAKAPVVVLRQVPNQPLLGNRYEDDLIAETFVHFMNSGDETWPLLLPMVKSAVRAMDATQEFFSRERDESIEKFVVTGASKRGWTTWLTGAVDKRVKAICPMVIDTLNFYKQLPNQIRIWGEYSEQIRDYTSRGLIEQLRTPRGRVLTSIVDPYSYRTRYDLPKLIINGTNDRYWVVDALNHYWDELPDPKYALYLPNAGHGLEQHRDYAVRGVAAFVRHVAEGHPLPKLSWQYTYTDKGLKLEVTSDQPVVGAQAWVAYVKDLDFRVAQWQAQPMAKSADGKWVIEVPEREGFNGAVFGDLTFKMADLEYHLSTLIWRVPELKLPDAQEAAAAAR